MKLYVLAALALVTSHSGLFASKIAVTVDESVRLNRVKVYRLSAPFKEIETKTKTSETSVLFEDLSDGDYSIVVWESIPPYAPTPVFDQTVTLADKDQVVKVSIAKENLHLKVRLPDEIELMLEGRFKDTTYIPCHVQRLEVGRVPRFGFRWLTFSRLPKGGYHTLCALPPGQYVFTFPYGGYSDMEPQPSFLSHLTPPLALWAFPLTIGPKADAEIVMGGMTIDVTWMREK